MEERVRRTRLWEVAWLEAQESGMTRRSAQFFLLRADECELSPCERIVALRLLSSWDYKQIKTEESMSQSSLDKYILGVRQKTGMPSRIAALLYLTGAIDATPDGAQYRDEQLRRELGIIQGVYRASTYRAEA